MKYPIYLLRQNGFAVVPAEDLSMETGEPHDEGWYIWALDVPEGPFESENEAIRYQKGG